VPLQPDADNTEYPVSGVTVNVAVWPWTTETIEGEIDPLSPEAADTLKDGVTEGISRAEPPPPPPQEINNGIRRVRKAV